MRRQSGSPRQLETAALSTDLRPFHQQLAKPSVCRIVNHAAACAPERRRSAEPTSTRLPAASACGIVERLESTYGFHLPGQSYHWENPDPWLLLDQSTAIAIVFHWLQVRSGLMFSPATSFAFGPGALFLVRVVVVFARRELFSLRCCCSGAGPVFGGLPFFSIHPPDRKHILGSWATSRALHHSQPQ